MSNNKNKLRTELTNLYGGTNKFLTNAEITTLVNKSSGSNHLNIKKQAYKQAYSKYYNHLFGNVFNKMLQIVKSEMKPSPQCPTGVNSESVIKAAERAVQKRLPSSIAGAGTIRGVKYGVMAGGAIGGATGAAATLAARGGIATARGLGTAAGKIAQFCKGNPTNPRCKNNFGSNSESNNETPNTNPNGANNARPNGANNARPNGRSSRKTAGQAPVRYASGNRSGAPQTRSRG
jgi:hypothetical protein